MASTSVEELGKLVSLHFPKNFRHLGPYSPARLEKLRGVKWGWKGKPPVKYNGRDRAPQSAWIRGSHNRDIDPKLRIKRWNIQPGDHVRLLVGTKKDKFVDEESREGGYKTYRVKEIFSSQNRLTLDGLTNKRSQVYPAKPPAPEDFEQWDRIDQERWNQRYTPLPAPLRRIHYSNVQLCVETFEDAKQISYAKHIKAGAIQVYKRDNGSGQPHELEYRWNRYYVGLKKSAENSSTLAPSGEHRWPIKSSKISPPRAASELDTDPGVSQQQTLRVVSPEEIAANPQIDSSILGVSERSPAPTNQVFADAYITDRDARSNPLIDDLMPLYLSEELSNRMAKHKIDADFWAKRFYESRERVQAGKKAVVEWRAGGRDSDLRAIMDLPIAGLEGVPLIPRTAKEVREAAQEEFDEQIAESRRTPRTMWKRGRSFSPERFRLWPEVRSELAKRILSSRFKEAEIMVDGKVDESLLDAAEVIRLDKTRDQFIWVKNARGLELSRKRRAKAKRDQRLSVRMSTLKLKRGKNMVIPSDAQAPAGPGGVPVPSTAQRKVSPYQGKPIAWGGVNVALRRLEARVRAKRDAQSS
ncbi:hypothetical protein BCR39DRAFT_524948 [Naematelia encephala]|uniref:Uncharacterized protein n=1 Tax=Naematelia encephala TaxID=71784 RepID=A0A1Y2BBB1_9TREE|nr:hypothetical protein BCR39DRAFT_524948 [Naematelia encephala]